MSEAPNFVLFEHALGYVLFRVKEFEDIGMALPQVSCFIFKENVENIFFVGSRSNFRPKKIYVYHQCRSF